MFPCKATQPVLLGVHTIAEKLLRLKPCVAAPSASTTHPIAIQISLCDSPWQTNIDATMGTEPKQWLAAQPWAATGVIVAEETDLQVFQGYI